MYIQYWHNTLNGWKYTPIDFILKIKIMYSKKNFALFWKSFFDLKKKIYNWKKYIWRCGIKYENYQIIM